MSFHQYFALKWAVAVYELKFTGILLLIIFIIWCVSVVWRRLGK